MSKHIKHINLYFMIALTLIIGIFISENVYAATIHYQQCSTSSIGLHESYGKYAVKNSVKNSGYYDGVINHVTIYNANGHVVYCTEEGMPSLNHSDTLTGPDYVSSDDNVDSSLMARALAYGYYAEETESDLNENKCTVSRLATQVLVHFVSKEVADDTKEWRTLTKSQIQSLLSGSLASSVAEKVVEIREDVLNHNLIPSFAFDTSQAALQDPNRMELKYVEANHHFTNNKTDSRGVFSTYTLGTAPSGITLNKSGQTLTITSKNDSVTTPISMSKVFKTGGKVYTRNDKDLQQTTYITPPTTKTVTGYVGYKYQEIGKGKIRLHKIDKYTGKNMQGATFGIFTDDACTTKATDYLGNALPDKETNKNGEVSWDNLYYPLDKAAQKTYYVKETKVPEGYVVDTEQSESIGAKNLCIPIILKPQNEEIEANREEVQALYNIPYGNVTILKQDDETGAVIAGVEFKLLQDNREQTPAVDINGKEVANVITNERGIAEFENIPYGDYILEEVKANDWYKVLEEPLYFTLSKDNDALKFVKQGTEAVPDENEPMLPLEKYKLGDPTNDGKINNDDLKIIEQIIAEEIEETPLQFYASDLNKDLKVDETDKDLMTKYIEGDTSLFEGLKEEDIPGQVQKRVTLSVTNKPIDMKISKQSITDKKELPGATIEIKNEKGEVFLKYKSGKEPKEFNIPIGDYTLTEKVAPKGYQALKTEVKFRVLSNGNVNLTSAKSNLYKLDRSKDNGDTDLDHLKIFNEVKKIKAPDTGSVIAISTVLIGALLIGGGGYFIFKKYKIED